MDRRNFLGRMLAATGAFTLPLDLLWKPLPAMEQAAYAPLKPQAVTGLLAMTKQIAKMVSEQASGLVLPGRDYKVGHGGELNGRLVHMTDQFDVDMGLCLEDIGPEGLDVARWLKPCADGLVRSIHDYRLNTFAPLPGITQCTYGSAESAICTGRGISVRGVYSSFYDIRLDEQRHMLRFSVLGGRA